MGMCQELDYQPAFKYPYEAPTKLGLPPLSVSLILEQPYSIGIHCRSNLSKSKLCKYCVPLPWPQ